MSKRARTVYRQIRQLITPLQSARDSPLFAHVQGCHHGWLAHPKAIITRNRSYHTLRLIVPISNTFYPR